MFLIIKVVRPSASIYIRKQLLFLVKCETISLTHLRHFVSCAPNFVYWGIAGRDNSLARNIVRILYSNKLKKAIRAVN